MKSGSKRVKQSLIISPPGFHTYHEGIIGEERRNIHLFWVRKKKIAEFIVFSLTVDPATSAKKLKHCFVASVLPAPDSPEIKMALFR